MNSFTTYCLTDFGRTRTLDEEEDVEITTLGMTLEVDMHRLVISEVMDTIRQGNELDRIYREMHR